MIDDTTTQDQLIDQSIDQSADQSDELTDKQTSDQEEQDDVIEDAVQSASKWSKVSKSRQQSRTNLYWIIGSIAFIGLVMVFSSHVFSTRNQAQTAVLLNDNMGRNNYNGTLNANLAHIRSSRNQSDHNSTLSVNTSDVDQALLEKQLLASLAKKYLARQNAPTNMYSVSGEVSNVTVPTKKAAGVGFVDRSQNAQFANQAITATSVVAERILHPDFTIVSGEFIHAILETAINSDLPGMVRAVITDPVYAYTGEKVLIPAGSRLIGQYSSSVVQEENRVMVIWVRVILPTSITIQLNSSGTDALGRAGQGADRVNTHFWARFGEASLLSIIGAGAANYGVDANDQYNSSAAYRAAITQSFQQAAQKSLQNTLSTKPTLHIYQGTQVNVFVSHDLDFYMPFQQHGDNDNQGMGDF